MAVAAACLLPDDPDALSELIVDRLLLDRACVFLTGEAGTGKTHLTKAVLAKLGSTAVVTAYTGVAALQLGEGNALTVHKALGLPVFERGTTPERATQSVVAHYQGVALGSLRDRKSSLTRERIRQHDVLVIDEAGMVPADMLGHIDLALRIVRQAPDRPFGGMGVLAVGDVLQLPPVEAVSGFIFRAPVWEAFGTVLLRRVHRQLDSSLAPLLNALRMGRPPTGEALTLGVVCEARSVAGCKAVALMSRRDAVARVNDEMMGRLLAGSAASCVSRVPVPFRTNGDARVVTDLREAVIDELHCRGKATQTWVVGMRVMVVRNFSAVVAPATAPPPNACAGAAPAETVSIVNGDTGTVVALVADGKAPGPSAPRWPVVELDRFPGQRVTVPAADWKRAHCGAVHRDPQTHRPTGHGSDCFTKVSAVPLIPAWAMTCHKAQGATVPVCTKVVVHTTSNSAAGSLYVAASRVRDKDQLAFVGGGWRTPTASGEARQFFLDLTRRAAAVDAAEAGGAAQAQAQAPGWTWGKDGFTRGQAVVAPTAHLPVWIPPAAAPGPAGAGAGEAVGMGAGAGAAGTDGAAARMAQAACADPAKAVMQASEVFSEIATKAASGGIDTALSTVVVPVLRELAARFPTGAAKGKGRGRRSTGSLLWPLLQAIAKAEAKCTNATTQDTTDAPEQPKKRQRRQEDPTACASPATTGKPTPKPGLKQARPTKPKGRRPSKQPPPEPSSADSSPSPAS